METQTDQQCIFCQIVSGQIPAKKVYEDSNFYVILDINPTNPGHCIIISKKHYNVMPQLPDNELKELGVLSRKISQAMLKSLGARGTNLFVANGVSAGQRASHFLLQIFPRVPNDQVGLVIPEGTDENFAETQKNMVSILNNMFGVDTKIDVKDDSPKVEKKVKKGSLDDIAKFLLKK